MSSKPAFFLNLEVIIPQLLKAYPAFYKPIVLEASEWIYEDGSILSIILFGRLAHAVQEKIADYDYDNIEKMFELMEEFASSDNEDLSTAVLTGFMEAMFNYSAEYDPKYLACLLGPTSREYLQAWEVFNGLDPSWLAPKKP